MRPHGKTWDAQMLVKLCTATVDWDATGSMLSGWAAWAGVAAVLYAANRGASVFASWKRQKLEERRMETAERILAVTYKLDRAFPSIRGPFSTASESKQADKMLVEAGFDLENLPNRSNL